VVSSERLSPEKIEALQRFAEGRKAYKLLDFARARDWFASALEADATDGPSRVYLERSQYYLANPPPDDWDGVFDMKTK